MENKIKQVIIVRKDLKMRRGKEIVQGSHASMAFLLEPLSKNSKKLFNSWVNTGQTKICVSVDSEMELLDMYNLAKAKNLEVHIIRDSGLTEFKEPTLTAIAIGPNKSSDIDEITRGLPLR